MKYTCPMHPEVQQDSPGSCPICGMDLQLPQEKAPKEMSLRLWLALACLLPILFLSASNNYYFIWIQALLATFIVCFCGFSFFIRGWQSILSRNLNMFTLISLGIGVTYLYSLSVALFFKHHHQELHVYFEAASVITTLTLVGQVLELKARTKVSLAIYKLLQLSPKTARVIQSNKEEIDVPLDQIRKGDLLRVRPGEKVPTDGVILEGAGSLNESMMTGESFPVSKKVNDSVIGATLNLKGSFVMRAEKTGSETFLARIVQKVAEAQRTKAPIQKLADVISSYFVPVVLVIALITFIIWSFLGPSISQALLNAVSVLMIACPCALGLATPMSLMVGIGQAATDGIFIKDGSALEILSKVDTLILDKTGTLTEGSPTVTTLTPLDRTTEDELIQLAASLECASEHPLSIPILEKAKEKKLSLLPVEGFKNITGKGILGTIDGKTVSIGNEALLFELQINLSNLIEPDIKDQTLLYVSVEKKLLGFFVITDRIKESAQEAIHKFHQEGLFTFLVTGDRKSVAASVGKALHIDTVSSELLPEGKGNIIKHLQSKGNIVAMIGDGINDAPALALADVGIAMGKGSDIAIDSAGITLPGGDLRLILKARELACATMRNIRQNLSFAFIYNVLGILIAAGLFYPLFGLLLSPMIASVAMTLSSLSVVLNSLRLKQGKTKKPTPLSILPLIVLFVGAYIFYDDQFALAPKTLEGSVQKMLTEEEFLIQIKKMNGGFANDIWQVQTDKGRYILRAKTKRVSPSAFIKDLEMAKKAFEYGIGPEVVGSNVRKQQILLKYIEHVPWPAYEENPEPYKKTMLLLKTFHEKMPSSRRIDREAIYAPFSYIFYVGKQLEKKEGMPRHFSIALRQTEKFLEELTPWLKDHATLCHGDFCKSNVLLSPNLIPLLIDFDSVSIGHPVFDVVKFSLSLLPNQRLELFQTYLENPNPSLEDLRHFEIMDLSLLMLVAILRFDEARHGPPQEQWTKAELENLLDSKDPLPSFRSVDFLDTSSKARQLGAAYALAEFLKRSKELE